MAELKITDIMLAHAEQAAGYALARYRMRLDYSSASLADVDRALEALHHERPKTWLAKTLRGKRSDAEARDLATMWAGYVGETIRRHCGGYWKSSLQPGGEVKILLDVAGNRYPLAEALRRRIIEGRGEGAAALYAKVVTDLGIKRTPFTPPRAPEPVVPVAPAPAPEPESAAPPAGAATVPPADEPQEPAPLPAIPLEPPPPPAQPEDGHRRSIFE